MNDNNPEDTNTTDSTQQLLDVLVANHRQFLAFLEKRVKDRAIAEDILQDAFTRSVDKLREVRQEESVVAWFYRMLRNAVTDQYRRTDTRSRALEVLAQELNSPEPTEPLHQQVCACITRLATTLKPEYSTVLHKVEIEGVAVKDYAEQEGITQSNAGIRLFRARDALRKRVTQACGSCADHGCWDCCCGK